MVTVAELETVVGKYFANTTSNEEKREIEKVLVEKNTQNMFLKSVKSQDLDEVVSFLHHIGISSKNIDNGLKLTVKKIRKGKEGKRC